MHPPPPRACRTSPPWCRPFCNKWFAHDSRGFSCFQQDKFQNMSDQIVCKYFLFSELVLTCFLSSLRSWMSTKQQEISIRICLYLLCVYFVALLCLTVAFRTFFKLYFLNEQTWWNGIPHWWFGEVSGRSYGSGIALPVRIPLVAHELPGWRWWFEVDVEVL